MLEWPIAKGVYKTARPYDFGKGTDLSHYSAVKVPTSYLISQGQSDMDFISGYDTGIDKGIATVANHHISPGKKMWHWVDIKKGEHIGDVINPVTGKTEEYVTAPCGGKIFTLREFPIVYGGSLIARILGGETDA